VVVGTRGALRLFGPGSLGLAGLVTPDQLLRIPDFRAGERALALMWAAAERVRPDGAVIVQSQNPTHDAFEALARQDLRAFYTKELSHRAEVGYPPFRRLAVLTVRGESPADTRRRAEAVLAGLRGGGLTVYPPIPDRKETASRIVVKGPADLPRTLAPLVAEFRGARPQRRGIIDVEVDPVEWQS
jgi:primosomal protein N'